MMQRVISFMVAAVALTGCGRGVSSKQACLANLKQIEGAKLTWAIDYHKSTNDIPAHSDLFGKTNYIRDSLTCPHGGSYTIGRIGEAPRCSAPHPGLSCGNNYAAGMDETLQFYSRSKASAASE